MLGVRNVFIVDKYYFVVSKHIRLSFAYYFIAKILSKREIQQDAINHLSDIEIYKLKNLKKLLLNHILL